MTTAGNPKDLFNVQFTTDYGQTFAINGIDREGVDIIIENKRANSVFTSTDRRGNITVIDFSKITFVEFFRATI